MFFNRVSARYSLHPGLCGTLKVWRCQVKPASGKRH